MCHAVCHKVESYLYLVSSHNVLETSKIRKTFKLNHLGLNDLNKKKINIVEDDCVVEDEYHGNHW